MKNRTGKELARTATTEAQSKSYARMVLHVQTSISETLLYGQMREAQSPTLAKAHMARELV
jgi:hypothetical protein